MGGYNSTMDGVDTAAANAAGSVGVAEAASQANAAAAATSSGQPASAGWYQQEIAQREAQAAANNPQGGVVGLSSSTQAGGGTTVSQNPETSLLPSTLPYAATISPERIQQINAQAAQPSALQSRSDFTPIQQLGDTGTQLLISQGYSPVQSLLMQANAAKGTPGLTDDRYYANELQKAAQNYVATSSEYHAWGKSTGVPVAANRYEYTGDLALGFLKGTEGKSAAQVTTPTDLSVLGLPGGRGIQDVAWGAAIGSGKLDYTGFVNAANVISRAASEQQMGPYGALASTAYIDGVGYRLTVPEQQAIAIQAAKTAGDTIHPERLATPWVIPSDIGLGSAYRGIGSSSSGVSESVDRLAGGQLLAGIPTMDLPTPFKSTYTPTPINEFADFGGFGGGLIGHTIWGPQSPNVIRGLLAASVSDATAGLVNITGIVPGSAQGKPYGEFSSWSTSAGEVVTARRGYTKEQLEIYGYGLESKPISSVKDVTDRLAYGFVKTMSTNPGAIASGAGAGAIWAAGGEALGGAAGAIAAGGGRLAPAAARAVAFGESSLGTMLPVAAFGGLTTYSASEGFTATPSKTLINIGADIPGLAAMGVGAVGTKMAIQSGALGFQSKETKYIPGFEPRTIDLTGLTPVERPLATNPPSRSTSLSEPYLLVGKTRYGYETVKTEFNPEPFVALPGVRPLLSGSEMGSVSQSARMGFVEPGKTQSTTAFILGSRGTPLEFQPESVQTQLFKMGLLEDVRTIPLPTTEPTSIAGVKMASPQPFAGLAEQMGLRIEPAGIGRSTERGLEISGAPMSQRMFEMTTTIGGIKSGGYTSLEEIIGSSAMSSRVKPATQAAEAQMILPSATKQTFQENVVISQKRFEQALTGVFESEKRIPSATARDNSPTRATFEQATMARQSMQLPSVASIFRTTERQISNQLPSTSTLPTQVQRQMGGINQNTLSSPMQTNIPSVAQRTDMFRLTTQTPSTTPRPDMFARTNPYGTSTPKPPKEPTPDVFKINRPVPPPPIPPSPKTPGIPPPSIPIPPFILGVPSLGGNAAGPWGRKRRRNYLEEFRMGLDISFYGGMNTPRSPLPKFTGIPGSIQRKQMSPSEFEKEERRKSKKRRR